MTILLAMAKSGSNGRKKNSIVKLKIAVEKLQRSLLLHKRAVDHVDRCDQEFEDTCHSISSVPKDVKEGHFAVIAVDDGHPKRFIVSLKYLTNPSFLRLLEQAAEEYGFDHEGALTIPCRSSELESILAGEQSVEKMHANGNDTTTVYNSNDHWYSCESMVESC
ncbi:hypothetical protein Syun_000822 [Stephania yunnanensis]|uniref:Small auxin up regulated protein n=1 Tax=Stephania yunnanensis TaxID=152371 RepID=A0AAP0Q5P4_9MAGN